VTSIPGLWVRNGRIYAGTFGQGVFVSDDRGATWQAFNQGLVGGFLDTQLFISDLVVRGDSPLRGHLGSRRVRPGPDRRDDVASLRRRVRAESIVEPESSWRSAARGLLVTAPSNGFVFVQDPGDPDWTLSNLDNIGPHAGLSSQSAVWTGTAWVVGTNNGIFHSSSGQEPWTRLNPGRRERELGEVAVDKQHLFLALDVVTGAWLEESDDDGASLHSPEFQPGVFVFKLAAGKNDLYAARGDGLWRRPLGAVTSCPSTMPPVRLHFAVAGRQPFGSGTRLRFQLPRDGSISIELFDVQGRLVGPRIEGWQAAVRTRSLWMPGLSAPVSTSLASPRATRGKVLRLIHVR
jgi:hypothetical protein